MVVLHVVVQEGGLAERLQAARHFTLEGVVVQLNGQDWWWLVFDDPIHYTP